MPRLTATQVLFLAVNAAIGLAVGSAAARSAQFAALQIPVFAWLVAGLLIFELLMGLAFKAHPAAIVPMPLRFAGLMMSFAVCYATLSLLRAA